MMPSSTARSTMMQPSNSLPITRMGERVVTTIEKQELRELPTQTEYLQPGQQPYGIRAASSSSSNNQGGGMLASGNSGELPLEMMMPRELLSPPPLNEEQQPTVAPTNQYLAPMETAEATSQSNQNSMPMRQYLAPPMSSSDEPQQMNSITGNNNHNFAPEMHAHDQQETRPKSFPPSRQYLAPMSMPAQEHASREASVTVPTNQYMAPPVMPSGEQQLQQHSDQAVRYLPPQQQMLEMPARQYLSPHIQIHEMQMQQQMEPAQRSQAMPASNYLPPTSKMSPPTSEMSSPPMEVVPQALPSREYLSPFGEAENVAEAAQEVAQEATAMFEEQSAHQPTAPALAEAPASYYLPPQSPVAQELNYRQQYHATQPQPEAEAEQMPPVEFVLRHHQLMTQLGSVDNAPVSFAQFQSMSSAAPPTALTAAEPMPAHFLNDNGYHYRNGGSSEGLSNGNIDVRRFRVRH